MEKLTKLNGLSDAGISALQYAPDMQTVVVGYANGNIDLVAGKNVYNIPDLKRSGMYADKRINHICISGATAYLSCVFGIVAIDLPSRKVLDTYIIGDGGVLVAVNEVAEHAGFLYAATAKGVKKADRQSRQLTDFASWKSISDLPDANEAWTHIISSGKYLYISTVHGKIAKYEYAFIEYMTLPFAGEKIQKLATDDGFLLVCTSQGVHVFDEHNMLKNSISMFGNDPADIWDIVPDAGGYYIADKRKGLIRWRSANEWSVCTLNSPSSNFATALRFKSGKLLSVSGGIGEDGLPLNRQGELHVFSGDRWDSFAPGGLFDFTGVDTDADKYFVSSWGGGVYVFENGNIAEHYTQQNSALTDNRCGGVLSDGNRLWITCGNRAATLENSQWKISAWQTVTSAGQLTEDRHGQLWTTLRNNGLWVFDKNAVLQGQSDKAIGFMPYNYTGTTPVSTVHQIAVAPDGVVWVATAQGPVYYNNAVSIADGGTMVGFHPNRTGTEESNHLYALLGSENTLSVAVDGAYRKWFGTENGGVFLIDEDNAGEIRHFTTDNSPLFSNRIHDIAINDKTGEVFFATPYGIISYRSDAVAAGDDFAAVYVFPNPVRPDYQGEITITGLIKDADVRITDIAGNLVYRTQSTGGQAVWNGCNQKGRRVASGVYLVFCSNEDASKTHVTKLLFIR
jgi:ligand-binding sensor domain-containing protein